MNRTALLQMAIKLAAKSDSFRWEARLQATAEGANHLLKRSYLQGRGAIRLLTWAKL